MSYFEDEILRDLIVGEVYNSRQIDIFLHENKRAMVLSDDESLTINTEIRYEVIGVQKQYVHSRGERPELVPNPLITVYTIKRVN